LCQQWCQPLVSLVDTSVDNAWLGNFLEMRREIVVLAHRNKSPFGLLVAQGYRSLVELRCCPGVPRDTVTRGTVRLTDTMFIDGSQVHHGVGIALGSRQRVKPPDLSNIRSDPLTRRIAHGEVKLALGVALSG